MHSVKRREEEVSRLHFSDTAEPIGNDDLEFSSEPMPAAFGACVFLGIGLVLWVVAVIFI
jgi:hypothetical protein